MSIESVAAATMVSGSANVEATVAGSGRVAQASEP